MTKLFTSLLAIIFTLSPPALAWKETTGKVPIFLHWHVAIYCDTAEQVREAINLRVFQRDVHPQVIADHLNAINHGPVCFFMWYDRARVLEVLPPERRLLGGRFRIVKVQPVVDSEWAQYTYVSTSEGEEEL